MKKRYLVVYEKAPSNYGAFAPDVPGCASLGETLEETRRLMSEGLRFHLDMLVEDGEPIPEPITTAYDFAEDTPENGVAHCVRLRMAGGQKIPDMKTHLCELAAA